MAGGGLSNYGSDGQVYLVGCRTLTSGLTFIQSFHIMFGQQISSVRVPVVVEVNSASPQLKTH